MGRLESLLSGFGLLVIGLLVLMAVLRYVRSRKGDGGVSGDPLDLDPGEPSRGGRRELATIHPDFRSLLDHALLPRRAAHPDWERLDGAYDVRGRILASFLHDGTVYGINGESSTAAVMAIDAWMRAHPGEDPFLVPTGKGPKGRLVPRPEIGIPASRSLRIETI